MLAQEFGGRCLDEGLSHYSSAQDKMVEVLSATVPRMMSYYRSKTMPIQACKQFSATCSNNNFVFWGGVSHAFVIHLLLLVFCFGGGLFLFPGRTLWCGIRMIRHHEGSAKRKILAYSRFSWFRTTSPKESKET